MNRPGTRGGSIPCRTDGSHGETEGVPEDVELATLSWVHWWNTARLHSAIGNVPPAEFEAAHYPRASRLTRLVPTNRASSVPRGGSPPTGRATVYIETSEVGQSKSGHLPAARAATRLALPLGDVGHPSGVEFRVRPEDALDQVDGPGLGVAVSDVGFVCF